MSEATTSTPSPAQAASLFHYCSSESFLSILRDRRVFASALSLSNDTMEGKWIEQVFSRLCDLDKDLAVHQARLRDIFQMVTQLFGGLGFCLSEDGDLLSQWRGYADNGMGVSIGFNPEYLTHISLKKQRGSLQKVIYNVSEQEAALKPLLEEIKTHVKDGALKSTNGGLLSQPSEEEKQQIRKASASLWGSLFIASFPVVYKFKNPAFSEEKEWRLLAHLINEKGQMSLDELKDLDFRARNDRITPVRSYDLETSEIPAIFEVVLGPKNISPPEVISAALVKFGFTGVKLSRSSATYR